MRDAILNKINESAYLQRINLSNMNIQDDEIQEIMDTILTRNPKISCFNLDNNALKGNGGKILGKCLKRFENVEEISLQRNQIDRAGALALFQLKNDFPNLNIAFYGNQISDVAEMEEIKHMALSDRDSLE